MRVRRGRKACVFRRTKWGNSPLRHGSGGCCFRADRRPVLEFASRPAILPIGNIICHLPNLWPDCPPTAERKRWPIVFSGIWRSVRGCGQLSIRAFARDKRIEGSSHLNYLNFSNF
ncbi:conserved hypothetical protein [Brucella anthropi ATCC 49188]|uniref:Uncharacterized protein n=1 Tax=Brucella anthropi (strain ATCC 49188 / DSM 6882 / CCUG 24695 / JCM 21032 / LMG 3331 / NBRC 15819 / NCTC 12168 / Alc 37) TaxID=439375 RepID=A6X4T9_BRUA4|nr:conserved hypothetical protein [Brucella anthropi ATCC 49188]